jgi:hypothetical protein
MQQLNCTNYDNLIAFSGSLILQSGANFYPLMIIVNDDNDTDDNDDDVDDAGVGDAYSNRCDYQPLIGRVSAILLNNVFVSNKLNIANQSQPINN